MKTQRKQQIITYIILFVLLVIRILVSDPFLNLERIFGVTHQPAILAEILKATQGAAYYLLHS